MSKDKALAAKLREVSGLGDGNMRAHADVIRQWTAEAATRLEALQAQPVGEDRLIEIANRAVKENLNPDGTTKYRSAQGYACALSALRLAALTASPPVVVSPKWDVCRNCVDGSKAGQTCTVCEGRGHVPFVPTPVSPPVVEREAIARTDVEAPIPSAAAVWRDAYVAVYGCEPTHPVAAYQGAYDVIAQAMRDAILALTPVEKGITTDDTPVEGVGDAAGWSFVQHFRDAVGEDVWLSIPTYLQNWIMAKAFATHHALSTPVAQGDEVRDALEPFVAEWRSAGADHLADDMLWSDANAVEHVGMMLTVGDFRRLATLTKGARDAG